MSAGTGYRIIHRVLHGLETGFQVSVQLRQVSGHDGIQRHRQGHFLRSRPDQCGLYACRRGNGNHRQHSADTEERASDGGKVQRDIPRPAPQHHASRLPSHLLQQHGAVGDEPQDAPVPHGAQRDWRDAQHLHAPRLGGCGGRNQEDGGRAGKAGNRAEKSDPIGGKGYSADVPGGMNAAMTAGFLWGACLFFLSWKDFLTIT